MNSTLNPDLAKLKQQLVELSAATTEPDDALPLLAAICHVDEFATVSVPVPSKVALRLLLGIVRAERRDAGMRPVAPTFDAIEQTIHTAQGGLR